MATTLDEVMELANASNTLQLSPRFETTSPSRRRWSTRRHAHPVTGEPAWRS